MERNNGEVANTEVRGTVYLKSVRKKMNNGISKWPSISIAPSRGREHGRVENYSRIAP